MKQSCRKVSNCFWLVICIALLPNNPVESGHVMTTSHPRPASNATTLLPSATSTIANTPTNTTTNTTTINLNATTTTTTATTTSAANTSLVTFTILAEKLPEPECVSVMLLVELPVDMTIRTSYELSSTHAYVKRCIGVNNKNKACMCMDEEVKRKSYYVEKAMNSRMIDMIPVNWVYHEECGYKKRKCPFDEVQECHKNMYSHYYDEVNCTCNCIIQIEEMETCPGIPESYPSRVNVKASGNTLIWLPLLAFLFGVVVCAVFIYFKNRRDNN